MPYETVRRLEGAVDLGVVTDRVNDIIEYVNDRRDIPSRAAAVEELAVMQAQTTVRWMKKHGRSKALIRELLEL